MTLHLRSVGLCLVMLLSANAEGLTARDLFYTRRPTGAASYSSPHLGLRYRVLLVDPGTRAVRTAAHDQVFRGGDCIAFEVVANRNARLYLFTRGSSGAWQSLLPGVVMPDEPNDVKEGGAVQVPRLHCLSLDGTPGTETFFVVLTEHAKDVQLLKAAVHEMANGGVAQQLDELVLLRSRDVSVIRTGGERATEVYAVSGAQRAQDRIVIPIVLRHE